MIYKRAHPVPPLLVSKADAAKLLGLSEWVWVLEEESAP